jgi:hypothetical protein
LFSTRTLLRNNWGGMETQGQNINVVRSVWRRRIKKDIKLLDLTPVKDAKGGGIPGPGNIPTGPGQSPPQKPGGQ